MKNHKTPEVDLGMTLIIFAVGIIAMVYVFVKNNV